MQTNYILLTLFFGAVYFCSSIVPALAPSEVKSTRKQIIMLLKLTTTATIFLVASHYADSKIIGGIIAGLSLVILYLLKDDHSAYYLLPAIIGLSIMSENYYILTCMTTTLFLKGMADYGEIKKIKWTDRRISMFIYLVLTTVAVLILAKTINVATM